MSCSCRNFRCLIFMLNFLRSSQLCPRRRRSSHQRYSVKKVFLETSQNSQKNICRSLYFNKVAGLALQNNSEHLWTTASGVVFPKRVILNLPNLDLRSRGGRMQIKWWWQHWMCRKVPNVCRWSWSTRWSGSRINPTKSLQCFNPMMPSVNKMFKHMLKILEQMLQDF